MMKDTLRVPGNADFGRWLATYYKPLRGAWQY